MLATSDAPGTVRVDRRVALVSTGSPREVLARIVPGDPLGLRPLVARRLRARALLADADRVHLAALARTARSAATWRGRPPFEPWLQSCVDEAIDDVLTRERDVPDSAPRLTPRARGPRARSHPHDAYDVLAGPLGLSGVRLHSACMAFGRLPHDVREAFFLLVLEGLSLEDAADRASTGAVTLARRARRGLEVFLDPAPLHTPPPFPIPPHPEVQP